MTMPYRLLTMRQFQILTDLAKCGPRSVVTVRQNTLKAMQLRGFVEVFQRQDVMLVRITDAGRIELARG
jgi:DNA-binding PadR family transcriptional regulator